jgi:hypothetical protein
MSDQNILELVRTADPVNPTAPDKAVAARGEQLLRKILATPRQEVVDYQAVRRPRANGRARVLVAFAVAAGVVASGLAVASRLDRTPLTAATISALADPGTVVVGVPPEVDAMGARYQPEPGGLHQLGHGAYAWRLGDNICWVTKLAGGCLPRLEQPIAWTIKDPDASGSGAPALVFGLAVDGVDTVTVTLSNGREVSAAPVDNFYIVELPVDARPEDVTEVRATLAGNSVFSDRASH